MRKVLFILPLFLSLLIPVKNFASVSGERKLALLEFSVVQNGTKTDIKWSMNREPLGTFFTIEKSADGKNFSKIIDMPVATNGNLFEEYLETDYQPYKGFSFYRIKQTDDAGIAYYSDVITLKYNEEQTQRTCAGIPKNEPVVESNIKNAQGHQSLFVLRDVDGNDYYAKISLGREDNYLYAMNTFPQMPTGIYRIVGASNNQLYSLKLIIK